MSVRATIQVKKDRCVPSVRVGGLKDISKYITLYVGYDFSAMAKNHVR